MKVFYKKINGLKLKFFSWGNSNKPKLFLFHGWLDTAASFNFLCPHLEKHFYCLAPDMRGFGKSEHSKSPLGYFFHEYVADVNAIVDFFSPKKPVALLGHSMGGAITSIYAGACPERVSHFINVEGFAFRDNQPSRAPEKTAKWLAEIGQQGFPYFKNLQEFAARLMRQNPQLPPDRALFLAKHQTKKSHLGYQMAADPNHKLSDPHVFTREQLYAYWGQIQARCLLIWGKNSEMNQWVKAPDLAKEIEIRLQQFPKGSVIKKIDDCGHMVHHEKPVELAELMLDFFQN